MTPMSNLYPMLIRPRYVERIWGGHDLADRLGKDAPHDRPIGEAWEVYEENTVQNGAYAGRTIGDLRRALGRDLTGHVSPDELFPLLTKLIDATQTLSVQVHPDDRFARTVEHQPYGKTECWYVIHAEFDATLTYGFNQDSGPDEYAALVAEGKLDGMLRPLPVQAGDVVYIPAGMVHAIGAGIIVYELQQTSDTTYRIYDWNRRDAAGKARELHVDKASRVLDYHRITGGTIRTLTAPGSGRTMLIAGHYFCEELVEAAATGPLSTHESPVAVCALDRPLRVSVGDSTDRVDLAPYSSLLIPAAAGTYTLHPVEADGVPAPALVSYVPASDDATPNDLRSRGFSQQEVDDFMAQFAPAADLGQDARHEAVSR